MLTASDERLLRLPKAELHVHLDGSLRPATLLELAAERDVALPGGDDASLAKSLLVTDTASLEQYLAAFRHTLAVMQDGPALERIAYELVADNATDGVRYVEVRFCPGLCTEGGLGPDQVLDAVLAGLRRAERDFPVRTAVIVCALRSLSARASVEMAELAVTYRDRGVCAFDLAGAEAGHPVHDHLDAVQAAQRGGLPLTIHAGEGYGPPSIAQALELGRARRLGHGTRLGEDPDLLARVREAGVVLEVCLTSNVQTGATPSYEEHPLRGYFDSGVRATLCTDNRLMSGVTLVDEYRHARDALRFTWQELVALARAGFEAAFAPEETRGALLASFEGDVAGLG